MKRKIAPIIILFVILAIGFYAYRNYEIDSNSDGINIVKKNKYDLSYEIEGAKNIYDINKKAKVIENINTESNSIALTFEGISDKKNTEKILELLDLYNIKATFFITGIEAAEDEDIVETIKKHGHYIGSGTLNGSKNMEKLSRDELISDFSSANKILKDITKNNISLLKCSSTKYSDELLASAYASGNEYVVTPDYYLSYQSFKNYEETNGFIKKISRGNIISIKLEGVLDDFEYRKTDIEAKPEVDKKPTIDNIQNDNYVDKVTIVNIVEWILKSIKEENITPVNLEKLYSLNKKTDISFGENYISFNSDYILNNNNYDKKDENNENRKDENNNEVSKEVNFKELINNNKNNLSSVVSRFFTTEEALTYTFRGLSNENVLNNVLESLKKLNAKGTFFVTKEEIEEYPERIEKIIKYGHEIANGGITSSSRILDKSTEDICKEIYEVDKMLKEKGIQTNSYMASYGYTNSNIQEAVSTVRQIYGLGGYELITYTKAPIIEKYKNMKAEEIVNDYFNVNSYVSLSKGEIIYFRLDSNIFDNENEISNIIEILTENYVKNGHAYRFNEGTNSYDIVQIPLNYNILPIRNIQNTIEDRNTYGRYSVLANFNPLLGVSNDKVPDLIKNNYIGNKNVKLIDFTDDEIKEINNTGTIDTNGEDVIFITFDDWGGDPIINGILDVLNKHNVKASFFVLGRYFDEASNLSNINPNLLRTIALNGHDIASHTYNHDILNTDKIDLEWSLIESYNSMARIIGDLDSLTKFFRPPTLYVNKSGLTSVFESGYNYSISGNISTHDYESSSSDAIVKTIESQLIDGVGNIVIMHINNQSYYTAEAVDKFLTNNENGVYGKKYKIAKLSDYLFK